MMDVINDSKECGTSTLQGIAAELNKPWFSYWAQQVFVRYGYGESGAGWYIKKVMQPGNHIT